MRPDMDALGRLQRYSSEVNKTLDALTGYKLRVQTWITFDDEVLVTLTDHIENQVKEEVSR